MDREKREDLKKSCHQVPGGKTSEAVLELIADLEAAEKRIAELEKGYVPREATGEGPGWTQEEARYWYERCLRLERERDMTEAERNRKS